MEMTVSSLRVVLTWMDTFGVEPVTTMAYFAVFTDEQAVWPVWGDPDCALEIYADDLLSYLAEFWQPLMLRQTYPLPIAPQRPSQLRPEAEKTWGDLPEEEVQSQEDAISAFEEAHNLARCFGGQFYLPPLWVFRQGKQLFIEAAERLIKADFSTAMRELADLGDLIADRLYRGDSRKWGRLVGRWRDRDQGDPDILLAWATGLPRGSATTLRRQNILRSTSSVQEVANDDDELRVAARMAGALPVHAIERLLRRASDIPIQFTPDLDQLSHEMSSILTIGVQAMPPYEQGVAAARWIRDHLRLGSFNRAEPLRFLYRCNVYVAFEHLELETLDALAIWGRQHGPGVLLNRDSRRLALTRATDREPASQGAARVTAAHELCHLVLDREQALAAVDILNGRMPLAMEQRARAFAAAFMLPSEAAIRGWHDAGAERTRDGVASVLRRLTHRFGITTSVAAWQLEHGLRGQEPEVIFWLDQISPQRRGII